MTTKWKHKNIVLGQNIQTFNVTRWRRIGIRSPCFTMPFSFNTPSQYTLLNLQPLIFGLKLAAPYFANAYLLHYIL